MNQVSTQLTENVWHDANCTRCEVCRECMDCNLRPCSANGGVHTATYRGVEGSMRLTSCTRKAASDTNR